MYRANVLAVCVIFVAAPCVHGQEAKPTRRILAIGGGTYGGAERPLLKYLLTLTGKKDPVVYYLPTAAGDSPPGIVRWYEAMQDFECRPRHLRLFSDSKTLANFDARLLAADAIFVGGGNTMNMLTVWKAHGLDKILRQAYDRGIVLAGESAGMICWFDAGVTDSRAGQLTALDCLGFLKGSACPHYSLEKLRKPSYYRMLLAGELKDGVGCDDGAAILYENERLTKVVATTAQARAYRVRREETKVIEEPLAVEIIGVKKK